MKFLKFTAIMNITMGVLLVILGLGMGIVGTLVLTGNIDFIIDAFPDKDAEGLRQALDGGMSINDLFTPIVEKLPETVQDLLLYGADKIFTGVGFAILVWAIIVHFVMTITLLKQIERAQEGGGEVSRLLAFVTAFLSLIPTVVPGVFMVLGAFGKQPMPTSRNNRQVRSFR